MASGSPPPSQSLDASDIATPCTIIDATKRLRLRDREEEEEENDNEFEVKSDVSAGQYSQASEATTAVKNPFPQTSTKVYCHIDDEPTQYLMEVHVPPDLVTLGDVKRVLMRTNFKYYCKTVDPDSGYEVKAEVREDSQRLVPLQNGRFELFLLTIEGSTHSDGSSGKPRKIMVPAPAPTNGKMPMNYHHAAYQFDNSMLSTDSESMISGPMHYPMKGPLARLQLQNQYYQGGGGECLLPLKIVCSAC